MTRKSPHSVSKPPAVRPAIPLVSENELDEAFGNNSLWRIGTQAKKGQYFSGEELAAAIEANPGQPLPDDARDYLCRFLRGQVKKKRGPQKKPFSHSALITDIFVPILYREELRRFQKLRKAQGRGAKGELTPHELAAISVQKRFKRYAMITPRRLSNILSSRKLGR